MKPVSSPPPVTICVLTYGDYHPLARRCLESIGKHCDRRLYRLVVGANAVGPRTADYLKSLLRAGRVDRVHWSRANINKCPMMRRMFADVNTEFIWWFDDDSRFISPDALKRHLRAARRRPADTVMWGQAAVCDHPSTFTNMEDVSAFVRSASWYGGLTPPSLKPGGKGEFNHLGRGWGDPRWEFILGGAWMIRTSAVRALDWPDPRLMKLGDDVLLGEAIRQQGWCIANTRLPGVMLNRHPRRGSVGALPRRRRSSPVTGRTGCQIAGG